MISQIDLFKNLLLEVKNTQAFKVNIIKVDAIETNANFRAMCDKNFCGMYGKCYTCPPIVGDINELISKVKSYDYALVYQTVSKIEDSFDFEGMIVAKKATNSITQKIRKIFQCYEIFNALHLGAGGCGVCNQCAILTNEPCRFPNLAIPSLEAYGINVSQLAKASNMKYINGNNTVTYFGSVLFSLNGD